MNFYRLSGATFCHCINTIYQFNKPFLDNKMSAVDGAFKLFLISTTATRDCIRNTIGLLVMSLTLYFLLDLLQRDSN